MIGVSADSTYYCKTIKSQRKRYLFTNSSFHTTTHFDQKLKPFRSQCLHKVYKY